MFFHLSGGFVPTGQFSIGTSSRHTQEEGGGGGVLVSSKVETYIGSGEAS